MSRVEPQRPGNAAIAEKGVIAKPRQRSGSRHVAGRRLGDVGTGPNTPAARWVMTTGEFIRATAKPGCDFHDLGHELRVRETAFNNGTSKTAVTGAAQMMRAIVSAQLSLDDGASVLAAYLAEERGFFTKRRMITGLLAVGGTASPTFEATIRSAASSHDGYDPFMWVAAALRIWLDVPQALDDVVHDHEQPTS